MAWIELKCKQCSETFDCVSWKTQKFCNEKCYAESMKVRGICRVCKNKYKIRPRTILHHEDFCSLECKMTII